MGFVRERRARFRRRVCKFCADGVMAIDYKDIRTLQKFMTERGKILPSRVSGNCYRHQRRVKVAIKRAREIALLPYLAD